MLYLPDSLITLHCNKNIITRIKLPANIMKVDCSKNRIRVFKTIPDSLVNLICYRNQFVYDFEPTLENLRVYHNS